MSLNTNEGAHFEYGGEYRGDFVITVEIANVPETFRFNGDVPVSILSAAVSHRTLKL